MFTYAPLWETLQKRGVSTDALRDAHGIDSKTIRRLHRDENVTVETLDKLCHILQCGFADVVRHQLDEPQGEDCPTIAVP